MNFKEQIHAEFQDQGLEHVKFKFENRLYVGDTAGWALDWIRSQEAEKRMAQVVKTEVMAKAAKKQVSDKWILAISSAILGAAASALFSWMLSRH